MTDNAEKKQKWTTKDDPYVTPLGKFLRKSNLDEIPQFWDILIGNMSFVGPRPEQPEFVEKFEQEIPDYFRRHKVKSGLTGWAQVNGLKGDTSIRERVRYDMYYIENWSLWFDFRIIAKTIWLLFYELFKGKYEYRPNPRLDN
jgi:lipopolysaccharide/colanic/teichoic acid biosynthesis glycosyltransferase